MYPPTPRTTATRTPDRMSYDRDAAHAVLDEAYHCVLGFTVDGGPRLLPTLHVRVGDTLYLHGSTGSRPLLAARGDGLPICVAVTLLDGLVYARSQFHHSANYRSVVAHGTAHLVTDAGEKAAAMTALVEKAAPGAAGTPARRAAGRWPRRPCWRCRCARCPSGPAPAGYATTRPTCTCRTGPGWCRWR